MTDITKENEDKKLGWSWLGFFFAPYYYAGYGNLKKGSIYAVIGAFPLFGIIIAIISGRNAKKELPIGQQKFNWKNVAIAVVLTITSATIMKIVIGDSKPVIVTDAKAESLPICIETSTDMYTMSKGSIEEVALAFKNSLGENIYSIYPIEEGQQLIFKLRGETISFDVTYQELEKGACMEVIRTRVTDEKGNSKEATIDDGYRYLVKVTEHVFKF